MKMGMIAGLSLLSGAFAGCGGVPDQSADSALSSNTSRLSARTLDKTAQFFVPPPQTAAVQQVTKLIKSRDYANAAKLSAMALTPQAVWFESGTPKEVQRSVKQTMAAAALEKRVPVLVSYNIPFRDCSQYSAGGALDTAAYEAWIDAFAAGIGKGKAVVILEPDSVGIIPYYQPIFGSMDWCKPEITDATGKSVPAPGATPDERFAQLNYAIDSIQAKAPNALVYLDGTHSGWLGTQEAALRLIKAGVQKVPGFFLNASNYQPTNELVMFGTWVSKTITAASSAPSWAYSDPTNPTPLTFHFDWMPSQYADLDGDSVYTPNYTAEWAAQVDSGLATYVNGAAVTTRFVIDTSRNGQGPLDATKYASAPYGQSTAVVSALASGNWCNPPGAGLGLRPSANTGVSLLDAYVWIKTPGESDGSCDIAGGARAWDYGAYNPWNLSTDAQSHFDPLWGMVDPAAGAWFPQQAVQLVQQAKPALF